MSWLSVGRAQAEVADYLVRRHLDITITAEHITTAEALAVTIIGAQEGPIAEPLCRPFAILCARVARGAEVPLSPRVIRMLRRGAARTSEMLANGWVRVEGQHALFPTGDHL